MHPFTQSTAAAALREADELIWTLRAACRSRTERGTYALVSKALEQASYVRTHIASALTLEEMACATGEEEGQ